MAWFLGKSRKHFSIALAVIIELVAGLAIKLFSLPQLAKILQDKHDDISELMFCVMIVGVGL